MKKIILLLFLLISVFYIRDSFTQSPWWYEANTGVTTALTSIAPTSFYNYVWACGYNGLVIKTLTAPNGQWRTVNYGIPSTVILVNIFATDSSNALVAGYNTTATYVYKTSNGGYNWTQVFSQPNGYINAVWLRTSTLGLMVGNPVGGRWSLWKTTDGGISWDSSGLRLQQSGTELGWNNSLWVKGDSIWFGTNNLRVYFSSNFGINWLTQSTSPEISSNSIFFENAFSLPIYGFIGGDSMRMTTNYGNNWNQTPNISGTGTFVGFAANPPGVDLSNQIYWYARGNKIYMSFSPIYNWSQDHVASAGNYLYMGQQKTNAPFGGGTIYAVRSDGGISYCYCMFGSIRKINTEIPSAFNLYQDYPNPFNASTKFKFEISKLSNAKIVIYNVLGSETVALVNEELKAGTYEVEWDATNFPSGVYYYKLTAGGYIETKKMVFLK